MVRFLAYFVVVILLMIFLWGNMGNKASLNLVGSVVFKDVPVLIIILSSMLVGMLIMLPVMYLNRLRAVRKSRKKEAAVSAKKGKAAPAGAPPISAENSEKRVNS